MAARLGRLVIIAAIGTGAIVTQQLVSATTIAVEQIARTDSVLAELASTIDTINGPLSRVDSAETDLVALASDIDAAIERSLARVSTQLVGAPSSTPGVDQPTDERMAAARFGALALRAIDVERQAFVRAIRAAAASDSAPFHASGSRSIELHARKLAGTILGQREILEVGKSRALNQAEMMVALSSAAALLMMAYLIRRPMLAAQVALQRS
jgi:hypothetical protein